VKQRRVPMRMCLGCQQMKPKRELIRVVRTPQGEVVLDPTGKKSGRGAYVCPDPGCLEKAVKGKRLEKALERPVEPELLVSLREKLTPATGPERA